MNQAQPALSRHEPLRIADDTWVIQATLGEGKAPPRGSSQLDGHHRR